MSVIEVEALDKHYRRRRGGPVRALDGLDLSVPAGGVFVSKGAAVLGVAALLALVAPTFRARDIG